MKKVWKLLLVLMAVAVMLSCGNDAQDVLKRYEQGERNFSGANLKDADLKGVYLFKADLSEADLRGADLTNANLGGCNIKGADLTGAKLINTNLYAAYYDDNTKFPKGTDPNRYALNKVE